MGLVCAGRGAMADPSPQREPGRGSVAVLILLLPVGHVRGARVAPGAELTRHAAIRRTTRIAARPATRRGGPFGPSRWWVDGFSPREHGDELLDASPSGLGTLGCLDAVEDGVAISAVEVLEQGSRGRVGVEGRGEIGRHLDTRRSGVRGVPTAVSLGALHRGESRRLHAPFRYQPLSGCDVAL